MLPLCGGAAGTVCETITVSNHGDTPRARGRISHILARAPDGRSPKRPGSLGDGAEATSVWPEVG
jgi:hypothetical protein